MRKNIIIVAMRVGDPPVVVVPRRVVVVRCVCPRALSARRQGGAAGVLKLNTLRQSFFMLITTQPLRLASS